MRARSALAVLTALALTPAASSAGEPKDKSAATADREKSVFPYPVHQQTLDNGLKIIVIPMESGGLVSVRTAVRTGSRDEYEKGHSGFAHFFEHMMFRGTEKYPQDVYGDIVTRIGADANAYTSDDMTVYQLDIAAEDLPQVLEIESDRFQNLAYSKQQFQTEAGAVYGEYRKNRASPWFQLYEKISEVAFTKHTYGHTTMGYEKDIAAMPKMFDYSQKFFQRYYRPENVILIVAGDVKAEDVFSLAKEKYGPWKPGYQAPKIKKEPKQKKERKVEVAYEGRTLPLVMIGYKGDGYAPTDKTWVASMLLADLAFGETSDIHRKLVLEERAVQGINADAATSRDPGLWTVTAMVSDPSKVDYVLAEIDTTVKKYRETAPDAKRLEAQKSRMKYGFLMRLDTPAAVAGRLASIAAITGGIESIEQMYTTLEAVTPADVQAAAQKYLVQERRTVGILKEKK